MELAGARTLRVYGYIYYNSLLFSHISISQQSKLALESTSCGAQSDIYISLCCDQYILITASNGKVKRGESISVFFKILPDHFIHT